MNRVFCWLLPLTVLSCSSVSVVRVPLEARLGERESPPQNTVNKPTRVAVFRGLVANNPERRQDLTNQVAESYPSATHQAMTVPAALREVGFDVVELAALEDAPKSGAVYVLDLREPHVQSFHPAQGSSVTLVGSAYDVGVRYSAGLLDGNLKPLGVVEGHGHGQKRFLFMEPLAKLAFVGGLVSLATMGASFAALAVVFRFGLLEAVAGEKSSPFDVCSVRKPPDAGRVSSDTICKAASSYAIYTLFVVALSLSTGIAGALAGALGENVFDVFLAAMHLSWVDPAWKSLVKDAHDDAARSLADTLVTRANLDRIRASLPAPAPIGPPPAIPSPQDLVAPPPMEAPAVK